MMKSDRTKVEKEQQSKSETSKSNCNIPLVDNIISDEHHKCANCGKEINMTNKEHITIIHLQTHRYVCSNECMNEYYS